MSTMRLTFCAALAITALSTPAAATQHDYAAFPIGTLPPMPDESATPQEIPKGESVAGIFAVNAPLPKDPTRVQSALLRQIGLFTVEDDADAFEKGTLKNWGKRKIAPDVTTACFHVADRWEMKQGTLRAGRELAPIVNGAARGSLAAKQWEYYTSVRLVRLEQLVLGDATLPEGSPGREPSLRVVDAWLDPSTLAMRELTRATLPLVPVAEARGGLRIFAARTEGEVHFVAYRAPLESPKLDFIADMFNLRRGSDQDSLRCGHAHVVLRVTPGGGEHATLTTEIALPKRPSDETPDMEEVRTRRLALHFGVSQSADDPAPIVSLSLGWAGRTRRTRIR